MPLKRPPFSSDVSQALVDGLLDFADSGSPPSQNALPPEAWEGLHVFDLQLQDLRSDAGLGAAAPVGWRFLASQPAPAILTKPLKGKRLGDDGPGGNTQEDGVVAADVVQSASGGKPELVALLRDPRFSRALRAIQDVQNLPQVQDQDYELRVLRIPGILIEAFWLVSLGNQPDLLVPILSTAPELKRMQPYAANEFLPIARSLAGGFLKFDGFVKGPSEPPSLL